jgi:integrase/recombinase XerD
MVRPPKIQALPDMLTVDEIARLIRGARKRRFRVSWLAPYTMGLRLAETMKLGVDHQALANHRARTAGPARPLRPTSNRASAPRLVPARSAGVH